MSITLIEAHGGRLVNLLGDSRVSSALKDESNEYPSWTLTDRQICDLELLLKGAFSPLNGFMAQEDYQSVLESMRFADSTLWPIPVTLDVSDKFVGKIKGGEKISLRDKEGFSLAILTVSDIWQPDFEKEASAVYGTTDTTHPAVNYLFNIGNKNYIGGQIEGISLPHHYDYQKDRHTPEELRSIFAEKGWDKVVAFQTRNPLHRAHVEMTMRASRNLDAKLLIHPVVGMTKPGDVDHYTRIRCYQHVLKKYPRLVNGGRDASSS